MNGLPRAVSVVALLGLLSLAQAEHGFALFGIIWRTAVLSWDNPATQLQEDLATQVLPRSDPGGASRDQAIILDHPVGRALLAAPGRARCLARSAGITRSPPAL